MFVLAIFTLNSCSEIVDIEPQSVLTSQVVWKEEGDAIAGVNGLLSNFRNTINGDSFLFWFELRSGNWQYGRTAGGAGTLGWDHLFVNSLNPSASPGTDWSKFYTTINAANLAIKYIPEIDFKNQNTKNELLAQSYFIRAYCYYTLVRIYGEVPVLLSGFESVDTEDLYPHRKPVEEVFDQIKSDISQALDLYPSNEEISKYRPTNAAINMLKADVYLWSAKRLNKGNADLEQAKEAVNTIINQSNYSLLDDYENIFRNEANDEIIFSLYFAVNEAENHYLDLGTQNINDVPAEYQNNPIVVGNSPNRLTFSQEYIDNYLNKNEEDTRIPVIYQEFETPDQIYKWINKFIGEWRDGRRYFTSDIVLYRFAETLLFKAEILNALGASNEAIACLNEISKRAYGLENYYPSTLTQAEIDDAILDERLIEFGAEGKSWFDILRFGKAFTRIPSLIGRENEKNGNILLFPISPETITRNPNITQTPGY